jgi:hypothetical protein
MRKPSDIVIRGVAMLGLFDLATNPESLTAASACYLGRRSWIPGSRPLAKRQTTSARNDSAYDSNLEIALLAKWRVAVNFLDGTRQAEFREGKDVSVTQGLRGPIVTCARVHNDFNTLLFDEENAVA